MSTFWKRYSLLIIGSTFFFCFPVALINYIVDPFLSFRHNVPLGRFQPMFDERQQKTNYLAGDKRDIDTVILGNSRVAYLNPSNVPGKAFNYAVSSMRSFEFLPYLQFAASQSSLPIKTVLLGLSFVDTNAVTGIPSDPPEKYIEKATSWGFRYKSLLSIKLLHHSITSVKRELQVNPDDAYIREDDKRPVRHMALPVPPTVRQRAINENLATYKAHAYGKDYVYLDNRPVYMELTNSFPTTRFLVFTTPVSAHLLNLLVAQGLFDHYAQWLSHAVEIFGELWNFMYFNSVTTNDDYYKDAHHYSPQVCDMITRKLYDLKDENDEKNFGIKVTRENLEEHVDFLRRNMLTNKQTIFK